MDSQRLISPNIEEVDRIQDKFDKQLSDATSRFGEIGKSLERSDEYLKQQMQYIDRLAVLCGAVLAFSIPAFTSFQNSTHAITHRYFWLGCLLASWVLLIVAIAASVITHYLLIVFFAQCAYIRETNVLGILFGNINLVNERLMRLAKGDANQLQGVSPPSLSFSPKP